MPSPPLVAALLAGSLTGCQLDQGISRIPSPPTVSLDAVDPPLRQDGPVVQLDGAVSDEHDAPADLALSWTLDDAPWSPEVTREAGLVSVPLDPAVLSVGRHLVGLSARDSDGDMAEAWVTVAVLGPTGAPVVRITTPDDGVTFAVGETVAFQGVADDLSTAADDLQMAWSSDLDGALPGAISADGSSALITSALREGTHEITLTATDRDGESGDDAVSVVIGAADPTDTGEPATEEPGIDAEPGDLVLSEFMVDPDVVYDTAGEWFELYNTSGSRIEIQGYTLRDDDYDTWDIDVSMIIPPHSYFLVCAEMDPTYNGGVHGCDAEFYRPQMPPPGMAFGNSGDEIVLVRPDGAEIDRLEYDAAWVKTGKATGVDPAFLDSDNNDVLANWCAQTSVITDGGEPGTPGQENDPCP